MEINNNKKKKERRKNLRIISSLPFLMIIFVLSGWIIGFFHLQGSVNLNIPNSIRCLVFFGGLLVSILLGGFVGSILKRIFLRLSN